MARESLPVSRAPSTRECPIELSSDDDEHVAPKPPSRPKSPPLVAGPSSSRAAPAPSVASIKPEQSKSGRNSIGPTYSMKRTGSTASLERRPSSASRAAPSPIVTANGARSTTPTQDETSPRKKRKTSASSSDSPVEKPLRETKGDGDKAARKAARQAEKRASIAARLQSMKEDTVGARAARELRAAHDDGSAVTLAAGPAANTRDVEMQQQLSRVGAPLDPASVRALDEEAAAMVRSQSAWAAEPKRKVKRKRKATSSSGKPIVVPSAASDHSSVELVAAPTSRKGRKTSGSPAEAAEMEPAPAVAIVETDSPPEVAAPDPVPPPARILTPSPTPPISVPAPRPDPAPAMSPPSQKETNASDTLPAPIIPTPVVVGPVVAPSPHPPTASTSQPPLDQLLSALIEMTEANVATAPAPAPAPASNTAGPVLGSFIVRSKPPPITTEPHDMRAEILLYKRLNAENAADRASLRMYPSRLTASDRAKLVVAIAEREKRLLALDRRVRNAPSFMPVPSTPMPEPLTPEECELDEALRGFEAALDADEAVETTLKVPPSNAVRAVSTDDERPLAQTIGRSPPKPKPNGVVSANYGSPPVIVSSSVPARVPQVPNLAKPSGILAAAMARPLPVPGLALPSTAVKPPATSTQPIQQSAPPTGPSQCDRCGAACSSQLDLQRHIATCAVDLGSPSAATHPAQTPAPLPPKPLAPVPARPQPQPPTMQSPGSAWGVTHAPVMRTDQSGSRRTPPMQPTAGYTPSPGMIALNKAAGEYAERLRHGQTPTQQLRGSSAAAQPTKPPVLRSVPAVSHRPPPQPQQHTSAAPGPRKAARKSNGAGDGPAATATLGPAKQRPGTATQAPVQQRKPEIEPAFARRVLESMDQVTRDWLFALPEAGQQSVFDMFCVMKRFEQAGDSAKREQSRLAVLELAQRARDAAALVTVPTAHVSPPPPVAVNAPQPAPSASPVVLKQPPPLHLAFDLWLEAVHPSLRSHVPVLQSAGIDSPKAIFDFSREEWAGIVDEEAVKAGDRMTSTQKTMLKQRIGAYLKPDTA